MRNAHDCKPVEGLDIFWETIVYIYLSLSNVLNWTLTCGSAWYKKNIQKRKIQSKRVLGLINYTH